MEKLRQGPMLHLGVKGMDDDDDDDDVDVDVVCVITRTVRPESRTRNLFD